MHVASDSHPHTARGVWLLTLITFLWGTTFVVTKLTLNHYPASALVFARFLLAAIIFAPFLRPGRALWFAAAELGFLLWLGYATQTIGLQYTTVSRSAFITALHVIFVPVLVSLLGRRSRPVIWIAAAMALVGVAFLSHDGSPPNRGDAWTLICALCWAVYITRVETFTHRLASKPLTAAHLWVVTILSAGWMWYSQMKSAEPLYPIPWLAIVYLGIAATAATTWLQTIGQRYVSAPQAAILYTMEPVWAAMFGWLILHETPGPRGWTGAALIILAAVLAQVRFKPAREVPAA